MVRLENFFEGHRKVSGDLVSKRTCMAWGTPPARAPRRGGMPLRVGQAMSPRSSAPGSEHYRCRSTRDERVLRLDFFGVGRRVRISSRGFG